ncbi:diadenylate cyclase CdaA [Coprobacter tertius]|uniref:Diadenylate cyclase n=1 Tax=Coprobacter tertius TaxID=2944915 RepID=A0ABT1MM68_9BACT|nr:diadenylate cyclase CdaA [Coprobacter tertius]MCP9613001.1 diadenylate cyclase CdaA [Coprobacter tertius]
MFVHFGIKDIVDIILVALLLYNIYKLMKDSGTINIFAGVMAFIGVWIVVTQILDMKLMGAIMDKFISVGVLILVILFQDEIRRFLVELGSHKRWRFFFKLFFTDKEKNQNHAFILPIVYACMNMAKSKTGALIVIQKDIALTQFVQTGDIINANVNTRLIESIFFKNSPLHDGAVIIADNRIVAASCILPVSHSQDIPKSFGLRHRSGLGISQESDATAIIVSEETGNITVARNGRFYPKLSGKDLENLLSETSL